MRDRRDRSDIKLYFPGNLCRSAFAILAMFCFIMHFTSSCQAYRQRSNQGTLQVDNGQCEQDCGHRAKLHHLELLPLSVAERYWQILEMSGQFTSLIFVVSLVLTWCNKHGKTRDLETVCYSLAGDPDSDHKVKKFLTNLLETWSLGCLSEIARESWARTCMNFLKVRKAVASLVASTDKSQVTEKSNFTSRFIQPVRWEG